MATKAGDFEPPFSGLWKMLRMQNQGVALGWN
jgi:hypothetical protein